MLAKVYIVVPGNR